jgi:hypothetical protein
MDSRAKGGTRLLALVRMAAPLCKQAEREHPRTGPGRKPDHPDWLLAVLIMIAVLKRKKTKSSQFRWIHNHRKELKKVLEVKALPARSTYFDRYQRAHELFVHAIELQGKKAIGEGIVDPASVSADKSLVAARGPKWHKSDRQKNHIPKRLRGVDRDSTWGYSKHDGWVQGYSFEVVVSSTKNSTVFPLLASVSTACEKETTSFEPKIDHLPEETKHVLADSGYDSNYVAEQVEWRGERHRTGRCFLCPENRRNSKPQRKSTNQPPRNESHRRRQQRRKFYKSSRGRRLYTRRSQTVEPFNEWFKSLFELDERVWHRGLQNNQTQLLAAIFAYQLLLRYNYRQGYENGQIRWIIDSL